jgi:hypothetical protein
MRFPTYILFLLLTSICLHAQAGPADYMIAQERNRTAKEIAESEERRAQTYAIAIVVSGALIGSGLYLGLRRPKDKS